METLVQPAAVRRSGLQHQPAYASAALLRNRASRRATIKLRVKITLHCSFFQAGMTRQKKRGALMISKQNRKVVIAALTSLVLGLPVSSWADGFPGGVHDALGSRFNAGPRPPVLSRRAHAIGVDSVRYWNEIAINASGLDHTPVAVGENRVFGEQLGPGRSSRAMAIVHIAIFEAVNAIDGGCQSYTGLAAARPDTSMECAIAQAACATLDALFPSQKTAFDQQLASELGQIPNSPRKTDGVSLGHRVASAILAL